MLDLWQSVRANAPALVKQLITEGEVDVNERNDLGETALHLACSWGLDDVACVLLAHGADITMADWVRLHHRRLMFLFRWSWNKNLKSEFGSAGRVQNKSNQLTHFNSVYRNQDGQHCTAQHTTPIYQVRSPSYRVLYANAVVLISSVRSTAFLLVLRHARSLYGRQFMKTFLYDTKDFAQQSAMQLVSSATSLRVHNGLLEQELFDEGGDDGDEEKRLEPEHEVDEEDENRDLWKPASQEQRGGMVYTFGKVDFQLGYHLPHVNVQSSPRLVELPITSRIVQISASKFHSIALNDRGQVYVWGFGKGGRLGTGTEFDHVEPTRLTLLDEIPIASVAAGENHTLALSRSGQVFSWGSNSFGQLGHTVKATTHESRLTPKRVDAFKGIHMVGIAASGAHSGAICRDFGFVYTWGSNKRGQLGRKDGFAVDQPNATPKRVDRLVPGHALSVLYEPHDEVRVVQIAMSDIHTCVVLRCAKNGQSRGQVWQFGYGSNVPTRIVFKDKRRTGSSHALLTDKDAWTPRWKLRSHDIVAVSCAPNHSIALSACGSVYTWGHNGDALSHQSTGKTTSKDCASPPGTPQHVQLDKYGPVVSICASQDHCAVATQAGDLVSWGCGPQGVLGHGPGNSWQPSPKQVHGAKKVVGVAAGHQHTVVLVAPRLPQETRHSQRSPSSPPKLRQLLETKISQFLDISNVATVWKYAQAHSQWRLEKYCLEYMQLNWDAMLEMGSKERLDVLFGLMLPPAPEIVFKSEGALVPTDGKNSSNKVKPASERKSDRKASFSTDETKQSVVVKPPSGVEQEPVVAPPVIVSASPVAVMPKPQAQPQPQLSPAVAPATARRVKGAKFVSVDSFFSEKKENVRVKSALQPDSLTSPWSVATNAKAEKNVPTTSRTSTAQSKSSPAVVFPSLGDAQSRPPRKQSMEAFPRRSPSLLPSPGPLVASSHVSVPRKQVLCHDGSERAHVAAFSLDAFMKKSSRKKSRSDSIGEAAKPTWGGVQAAVAAASSGSGGCASTSTSGSATTPHKSLKQIQEEEEARKKAEAAAKAKNGGYVRKASSFNSWGLVQQQHHISLEELQRREEEERIVEEQRQIMAQIERENRQRLADEKRRAAKQSKTKKDTKATKDTTTQPPKQKPSKKKTETTKAADPQVVPVQEKRSGEHSGETKKSKKKPKSQKPPATKTEDCVGSNTSGTCTGTGTESTEPRRKNRNLRVKEASSAPAVSAA